MIIILINLRDRLKSEIFAYFYLDHVKNIVLKFNFLHDINLRTRIDFG